MADRIVLLVTSPRLPAGLLTARAWDLLRSHPVLAAPEGGRPTASVVAGGSGWPDAVRAAGGSLRLRPADESTTARVDGLLEAAAAHGTVVWLAGPTGDPELVRRLGRRLAERPGLAELEVVYGSWDPPGARLLDAVAVIDRLASPGGDPWKRAQTHASLAPYLLEEAYEAHDAIGTGDLTALREELGDVLLQVLLHARLAEEAPEERRWSIDDLATDFVAKMIRRNPHVFAGVEVADMAEILDNWERIKREEKPRRSAMDGIVTGQPALSLAAKVLERAERAGLAALPPGGPAPAGPTPHPPAPAAAEGVDAADPAALGEALLGIVAAARAAGVDAEAALRRVALATADRLRAALPSEWPAPGDDAAGTTGR